MIFLRLVLIKYFHIFFIVIVVSKFLDRDDRVFGKTTTAVNRSQNKEFQILIKEKIINVELAYTEDALNRGLMFRGTLKKDHGMLFVFPSSRILSFWMKNTFIDLSIAFINEDFVIVDLQEMKASKSASDVTFETYTSKIPSRYAIEMEKGWFHRKKIRIGDKVAGIDKIVSSLK